MNGPSDDFMNLGECQRCGELRRAHRVVPFFLALAVADDLALSLAEDDFGDAGFFEVDFDELGFLAADFCVLALDDLAAGFGDSDGAVVGDSANRRWT